ncbi:MAG: PASTA domain-containing protein [Anaerolineaceae bacterium]|nr:PASTA domain-containing protein [Anaerolineaceae bacterium]
MNCSNKMISKKVTVWFLLILLLLNASACIQEQSADSQSTPESENGHQIEGSCVIPNMTGLDEETAKSYLESMGLHVIKESMEDDSIQEGHIITVHPDPETLLEPCEGEVTYIVSLGSGKDMGEWEGWEVVKNDDYLNISIEDGTYVWETKTESTPLTIKLMPEIPDPGNFIISVEVEKHSGPANALAGIVFNYKDQDNFFAFSILESGIFMLVERAQGEWINYSPRQNSFNAIPGEAIRLSIYKYGTEYLFYINDEMVAKEAFINQPNITQVGLMLQSTSGISHFVFDRFEMESSAFAAMPTPTTPPILSSPTPTKSADYIFVLEEFSFYGDENFAVKSFGGGTASREITEAEKYKWSITSGSAFKHRALLKDNFGSLPDSGYSIELEANQISGENGVCSYGILFNYDETSGFSNVFEISGDHICQLSSLGDEEMVMESEECSILSEQANLLRLDLSENTIQASLNGSKIFESAYPSTAIVNVGDIGIQVDCLTESLSVFEFDNLKVFEAP